MFAFQFPISEIPNKFINTFSMDFEASPIEFFLSEPVQVMELNEL